MNYWQYKTMMPRHYMHPRLKSMKGSPDVINIHVSVTEVNLQFGGCRLWFDRERDALRQVYFFSILYMYEGIPTWHIPGRVYHLSIASLSSGRERLSCVSAHGDTQLEKNSERCPVPQAVSHSLH